MKKSIAVLLLALVLIGASAWAEDAPSAFLAVTRLEEMQKLLDDGAKIVSVDYTDGYGFSDSSFSTDDPGEIEALWTAFCQIEIEDTTNIEVTDWYPCIVFHLDDLSSFRVCFNMHNLDCEGELYTLKNDDLFWNLTAYLVKAHEEGRLWDGIPEGVIPQR